MPALTPEQEALKQAALAATPGPWFANEATDTLHAIRGENGRIVADVGYSGSLDHDADNAAYLAAANPAAILALLTQLEAAEEAPTESVMLANFGPSGPAQWSGANSVPALTGTELPADAEAQRKSAPELLALEIAAAKAGYALIPLADRAALTQPVQAVPDVLFEGNAVYQEIKRARGNKTMYVSTNAVSDVLDAAVRLIRAPGEAQ